MSDDVGPIVDDTPIGMASRGIAPGRRRAGRGLIWAASAVLVAVALVQILFVSGVTDIGFQNWRPVVYAWLLWSVCLGAAQVLIRGEHGQRSLFILPAVLFTVAMVIFPTISGFYIALTDWNLSQLEGRHFTGLDNFWQLLEDKFFWNALGNMIYYVMAVLAQYAIAFGLALLLNSEIRGRKFFRVAFLMPFMLSPVAVSWMIGKSIMEFRFGPASQLARFLGWDSPAWFTDPYIARASIMVLDAWVSIPFIMVLLLAGLQAVPGEVSEAAKVDGAGPWQSFWKITFPLTLPVSITAVILRVIFELKLADIVITVTSGGPGGATDTISSFIFREYRERSNVGYGTMIAQVYFIIIIVFVTVLLALASRWMKRFA